jgi:hypothetical protein
MYLLYLDWNAMGGLRGTPVGEFAKLAAFLELYRDRFWIPYSSTHLDDLARGYDPADAQKVKYTYDDLAFIRQLTNSRCFQTYYGQERPTPDWRDPVEFFESHHEHQQETRAGLASFGMPSNDALGGWGLMRELILDLPAIPFPEEAQDTNISEMFPGWSTAGTMRSVAQDFAALTSRANTDYTYSTGLRDTIRQGIPMLTPASVSSAAPHNAFDQIDKLLAPHTGGISIIEMMEKILINPSDSLQPPTLFQRFVHYYYLLELFGYHPEKLKPKNHFPNILGDATHAFLAGHCDFFVTDDKDLRFKAKAVYRKLPTRTLIMSVAEFMEFASAGLATYDTEKYPLYISNAIKDRIQPPGPLVEPPLFLLPYTLFDLFNAFELRTTNGIVFFRLENTYRYFTLPDVMEQLVETLFACLGPDDNGQLGFERLTEIAQMNVNNWPGRQWSNSLSITKLVCLDGEPELLIDFPATATDS